MEPNPWIPSAVLTEEHRHTDEELATLVALAGELTTAEVRDGIVLDAEHGSLMGESAEDLQRGVNAAVLYLCREPDGACPIGHHRGGPFLHYCDGYGPDDY